MSQDKWGSNKPDVDDVQDVAFTEIPRVGHADASIKSSTPPTRRRIGLHHIAFFRAYLEGLDVAEQGDRYLEFGRDLRKANATRRWLLDELVAAARKRQDFAAARLLKIKPQSIAPASAAAVGAGPSLEEFAESHDPDGFYTEKELLALFTASQPASRGAGEDSAAIRRQQRNARLRKRQLAALAELERLLVEVPQPDHHVLGWFDIHIALKLADVGLTTLGRLIAAVNAIGYRWYRNVPRLGERGAGRITSWLAANADALGLKIESNALVKSSPGAMRPALTRAIAPTIAPLEYFALPKLLDGSVGENRDLASRNKTGAANDKEAIEFWLRKYHNPNTYARYRNEAERLLLWAIFQKGKALSSLTIDDCNEYINAFLIAPEPATTWVMSQAEPRTSPFWRPFRGPLNQKSRDVALQAVKSLCESLTRAHWLDFNPFSEVRLATLARVDENGDARRQASRQHIQVERSLTLDAWRYAMDHLDRMPPGESSSRIRFILLFSYGTGLRRAELAAARTDDIVHAYGGPDIGTIFVLKVVGKGDRARRVPLTPFVLEALGDYLEYRGHPRDPTQCPQGTPLIPALSDKNTSSGTHTSLDRAKEGVGEFAKASQGVERPIHPERLYRAIKRFFGDVAAAAALDRKPLAQAFDQVTPHWLRHTFGSHALAGGMAAETARNFLGHASLDTTTIYSTAEIGRQYREADRFLRDAFTRA